MQETKISSTGDLTFPQAGDDWSSLEPDEAGIDPAKLREAITYSQDPAHEGCSGMGVLLRSGASLIAWI